MKQVERIQYVLPLLALVVCGGCAVENPFDRTASRGDASGTSVAGIRQNEPEYHRLSEAYGNQTNRPGQQPVSPVTQDPNLGNRLLTSVSGAAKSVSDALTIQPRRTPAPDPVSLATAPPEVGADLHYHAGRVHENNRDVPRAIAHYERALQTEPRDVRSMVALARVSDRAGDLQRAETLYSQAASLQPQDAAVLNDLGLCYAKQGNLAAAIETLSRAVSQGPGNKRYRNNLGTVLVNAGRPDEAWRHMAAVHGQAAAHYNVGYLLAKAGDDATARKHLSLALQADPRLDAARQMLSQLGSVAPAQVSMPSQQQQTRWSPPSQTVGNAAPSSSVDDASFRPLPPP